MKLIKGILNTNLVWELSNRFHWIAIHPMGLDVLDVKQKKYARQLNRNYVVTLKGIMTIREFSFVWASGDYSPSKLFELPNVYSPVVDKAESMRWNIYANKRQRYTKLVFNPYEQLFEIVTEPGSYLPKLRTKLTDLDKTYKPEDLDMLLTCLNYLNIVESNND